MPRGGHAARAYGHDRIGPFATHFHSYEVASRPSTARGPRFNPASTAPGNFRRIHDDYPARRRAWRSLAARLTDDRRPCLVRRVPQPRAGRPTAGLASLVLCGVVLATGCGGGMTNSATSPLPTGPQAHDATLLAGRQLFSTNCASCHGISGQGGLGPSFTGGRLLRDFPTAQNQIAFVATGRGAMPGFATALTPQQIADVVAYEREVLSADSTR